MGIPPYYRQYLTELRKVQVCLYLGKVKTKEMLGYISAILPRVVPLMFDVYCIFNNIRVMKPKQCTGSVIFCTRWRVGDP